jgi:hypothetical protein
MTTRTSTFLLLALALLGTTLFCRVARADEAACIAASESELALRQAGKLEDAIKQLAVCAAPTCSAAVKAECTRRMQELQAALPTIVLAATDEGGNDVSAVAVKLDGAPLVGSLDGRAIAVDPGTHSLRFETAGKPPVEKSFVFREGEKDRRISVALGAGGAVATAPVAAIAAGPAAPAGVPEATPSPRSTWNGRKTLAVVSGVVGLAGIGVGSAFGVATISDWSSSKNECSTGPGKCPNHTQAVSDQQSASTAGLLSTVGFGVGVAGLAGAAVLWFTAPSRRGEGGSGESAQAVRVVPLIGAGSGGVIVRGDF